MDRIMRFAISLLVRLSSPVVTFPLRAIVGVKVPCRAALLAQPGHVLRQTAQVPLIPTHDHLEISPGPLRKLVPEVSTVLRKARNPSQFCEPPGNNRVLKRATIDVVSEVISEAAHEMQATV